MRTLALGAMLVGGSGAAEGLFDASRDRAALGAELRALLTEEPDIVAKALSGPSPYQDAIADDLALIGREAAILFDPARDGFGPAGRPALVMFTASDCASCATAERDLSALAEAGALRVAVIRVDETPKDAALMGRLGLDLLPSYVLPDMMVRGDVPVFVLQRYLNR
ncbi:hypothetical protein VK792_12905 [Mesobacterium sp. TK19101]|uniref:Thioredoxin domain-containing protein n=1 Tax=Mesobacterium hydrothermale TaxID=3111907 RepID=A0ABU6HIN0_9RHOB|nr:hypothetical protein [Mesobacterium sp. TK19101]MEC3862186.1 hypothetical protein [Mesobacterium sp. TK19101]